MSNHVKWAVTGVAVVGAALAVWVFLGGGAGGADAWFGRSDENTFVAEDALELASDDATDRESSGPALEGRKAAPKPAGPTRIGDVEVLVLGPTNVPLPNVLLEAVPPAPGEGEPKIDALRAVTVEDGTTEFSQLPWDGAWSIRPVREDKTNTKHRWVASVRLSGEVFVLENPKAVPSVAVTGPKLRLVLRQGMPFSIEVVGASTGFVFETGPWAVRPDVARTKEITLSEAPFKPAAVTPGNDGHVRPYLGTFEGHVFAERSGYSTWISPRAQSLHAKVPIRPEAGLLVSLPDGLEIAAETDWEVTYAVGSRLRGKATANSDAYGRVRVLGVPFLPGEPVFVKGTVRKEGTLSAKGTFARDARDDLFLDGRYRPLTKKMVSVQKSMRKVEALKQQIEIELKVTEERVRVVQEVEAARAAMEATKELDAFKIELDAPERAKEKDAEDPLKGKLVVEVFTNRGKPAAGAAIHVANQSEVANHKGIATFTLPDGKHPISVVGAGATFQDVIDVVANEKTRVELTAPDGGKIDVEVVDENGDGLPFAMVVVNQMSHLPYADVEHGVQRVDLFTDHFGRRTFHQVQPGKVRLDVIYGRRKTSFDVVVRDGATAAARIVMLPPASVTAKDVESAVAKAKAAEMEEADQLRAAAVRLKESFKQMQKLREELEKDR